MNATGNTYQQRTIDMRSLAWLSAAAALFIALFWPTFKWMTERFDSPNSFYSHGWLIPIASAFLIWHKREALRHMKIAPSYRGMLLLVPSAAIHVLASWWHIGFVSGFAMVGVVWGLVWTAWGGPILWKLRFPMMFLLFMVPLPGIVLIATSFKMKLMAATMATHVVRMFGVPIQQAGSTLNIPGMSVIVDDTCSGLRSLISLVALSTLWSALLPVSARLLHRLAIVAASIPIALVANMVRIVVLVLLSAVYGSAVADSFIHYGSGIVVFGIALLVLAWLSAILVKADLVHGR